MKRVGEIRSCVPLYERGDAGDLSRIQTYCHQVVELIDSNHARRTDRYSLAPRRYALVYGLLVFIAGLGLLFVFTACSGDPWAPPMNDPCRSLPTAGSENDMLIPPDESPGIILISLDTLRADRLGCYGYPMATSPVLDRWSRTAMLFQNEQVQLPGTLPSHMSILTSIYPKQHSVYPPDAVLSEKIKLAAEMFQSVGYRTGGFTEGGYVDGDYGFRRGFETFRDDLRGWENILAAGMAFLETVSPESPFFLFLHTYQVHTPYAPPVSTKSIFCDMEYTPGIEPDGEALTAVNRGHRTISPEDIHYLSTLYDAEIRYTDSLFCRLFAFLSEHRLWDRVLLIVTSDHGEEFYEHGMMVHEQLYDPLLHVPLIVNPPVWNGPKIVSSLVESLDILPGMLRFGNVRPPDQIQGRDLFCVARSRRAELPAFAFSESVPKGAAVRTEEKGIRLKVIARNISAGGDAPVFLVQSDTIQVVGSDLCLDLRAYHAPRHVTIFFRDEVIAELEVGMRWNKHRIRLPEANSHSVNVIRLESDSCHRPSDVSNSKDMRCLSLVVRKTGSVPLIDGEMYDLDTDPGERHNLFMDNAESMIRWQRRIEKIWENQITIPPGKLRQDIQMKEELEALGYIMQ